jgi:glycerol uptake facilitator-like aquaporin
LALFRKFPPKKIIAYAVAQFFGAFSAAAILYMNVAGDLDLMDGGHRQVIGKNATLQIFTTTPRTSVDTLRAISSEIVCSTVLLFVVFALMHRCDAGHRTVQPVLIGMLVTLISLGMGVNTGPSMNPVRDLGPRTFTALAGWGTGVFTANNYYFWIPSLVPFLGGALGAFLYDSFLSI